MCRKVSALVVMGYPLPFPGAGCRRVSHIVHCLSHLSKVYVLTTVSALSLSKLKLSFESFPTFRIPVIFSDCKILQLFFAFLAFMYTFFLSFILRAHVLLISIPPGNIGLGAFFAGLLLKRKIIIDYRDEYEGSIFSPILYYKSKLYRIMLKHSHAVVAVTNTLAMNLVRNIGNINRVFCIRNVSNPKIFRPLPEKDRLAIREKFAMLPEDFVIVYNGHLGMSYYNVANVIAAIRILALKGVKNIKLLVIGKYPPQLNSLLERFDMTSYVKLIGVVQDPHVLSRIIASGDLGIIPYINHPLLKGCIPMKFYEYCACGLPVIATVHDDSELAHLIRKYKVGVIVSPDNPRVLAERLQELLQNTNALKEFGKNARTFVCKFSDVSVFCSRYLYIVKKLLANAT